MNYSRKGITFQCTYVYHLMCFFFKGPCTRVSDSSHMPSWQPACHSSNECVPHYAVFALVLLYVGLHVANCGALCMATCQLPISCDKVSLAPSNLIWQPGAWSWHDNWQNWHHRPEVVCSLYSVGTKLLTMIYSHRKIIYLEV